MLAVGYLLLLASWAMSNPPASAPDEYAHYLRAIGVGRGEFILDERPDPLPGGAESPALSWQQEQSGMVEVEGSLSPEAINCSSPEPRFGWYCPPVPLDPDETYELRTWVATYPPYAYVLPGLLMRLADDANTALLLGRAASALTSGVLIALAAWVLWDKERQWVCLLGLMGAITPMVIFTGSGLTSSGPEIAAGLCLVACLMRLSRPDQSPTTLVWLTTGFSGVILVVSRDLGVAWLGIAGLLLLGLSGVRSSWARLRGGGGPALFTSVLMVAAVAVALLWQVKVQVSPSLEVAELVNEVRNSFHVTKEVLRQEIGVFGSLNTVMPGLAYVAWALLLCVLGFLALTVGTLRERLVLVFAAGVAGVSPVVLEAVQNQVGFGVQGRHIMPISVAVPIVAGEILYRNADRLEWFKATRPAAWFAATAAGVHLVGWYINGRQRMVGAGPPVFWNELSSTPPLGWVTWGAVAVLGSSLIAGFGLGVSFPAAIRKLMPRKAA